MNAKLSYLEVSPGGGPGLLLFPELGVGGGAIALATHWPSVQEMPLCLIVSARQIINPRTERKAVHPSLPSCL